MATHSSVLAWRIPGMTEPGGLRLWGRTELDTTEEPQRQQQQLFQAWEDAGVWIPDIIPFTSISVIWAQYHCLSHPELLRAHSREWLQSDGYQMPGILLLECPQDSGTHIGGLESLMSVTSLFTDMAGNIPFLTNIHITNKLDISQYSIAVLSVVSLVILRIHLSGWSRDLRHMKQLRNYIAAHNCL